VTEDTPASACLIQCLLERAGIEVESAEDGLEACTKVKDSISNEPYDLILMDVQMPKLDGLEATRRLRKEGWSRPIVALTAHAMAGDRKKCLEAGCDDYLSKPIDRDRLFEIVARYLKADAFTKLKESKNK
jgi:CheY-like chemotaxis protein